MRVVGKRFDGVKEDLNIFDGGVAVDAVPQIEDVTSGACFVNDGEGAIANTRLIAHQHHRIEISLHRCNISTVA